MWSANAGSQARFLELDMELWEWENHTWNNPFGDDSVGRITLGAAEDLLCRNVLL